MVVGGGRKERGFLLLHEREREREEDEKATSLSEIDEGRRVRL